ncbi:MAG: hypothetical protein BMS9Abin13_285 [Patescibacteria group bacterium]|nr:MAG: hypothetical protein BMS9Abin13_285 [Patescibacteria group bacterium]
MKDTKKDISVIYEDKDILAINKPSGTIVHSDGKTKEYTVADWILKTYPALRNVGESFALPDGLVVPKPGIVHRLDRDTSGVLLIAKNQKTFLFLKQQFQEREVKKTYRAFVYGIIKEDRGVIDKPIGKSRKDFRQWSAERTARGMLREAVTEYKVLSRFPSQTSRHSASNSLGSGGVSYVEIYPKTGRTHQIRVHFKAIGYPVVCDRLYAPKRECALGFERVALHAFGVEFLSPAGVRMNLEVSLPDDFKKALHILNQQSGDPVAK